MVFFFGNLKPKIAVEFVDVVFYLLVECTCGITIYFSEVSIKHNLYTTNGKDETFEIINSFHIFRLFGFAKLQQQFH